MTDVIAANYGSHNVSGFISPFAAPPHLHAATLADRLHPTAADVEHTYPFPSKLKKKNFIRFGLNGLSM